ncbi:MAG: NADH-quinone oxidoreductase subunit M [Cyanobacteria bacterium HKST-UBA06]|nr:NADH-quinone oxidoreductase subunit M [Cyanobacteria bacterium HKST-UBA04]MCA9806926.1 NADH-quinone oxidoreductase subunit M [Cyanobacteria bacterium HKST-UBA06]MCA9841683.1 NADH-quinone oxidoreductase subunit M [Cyanobacteria bacterium HKST-UBA03]
MENLPVYSILIVLPLLLALIIPMLPDRDRLVHTVAVAGSAVLWVLSAFFWYTSLTTPFPNQTIPWFPSLGINYVVGADGLSWVLVLLTTFLVFLAVLASLTSINKRLRFYYSMLFVLAAAILGVFMARDLFVFFLFYELELIPMYFLIAVWGGPRRQYAAIKFVLYTLFGSIFLLAATLGLYFHAAQLLGASTASFEFGSLSAAASADMAMGLQILMFLGFFIAFCVKLPMVPFHTWLPDAHVEAPTPISMLLAGVLLKMGAYGLCRFCFGWFPDAALAMAPYVVLFGVINIIYTAGVAMVQSDLKKLIAYSSVSHMGFVLVGLGALNVVGFSGAVFQMISHGIISAGLFMMVGTLYTRTHTRLIAELGGFAKQTPTLYFFGLLICLSSLGLPLLAGFPAETLVFYGAFISNAFSSINLFGTTLDWSIQTLTVVAGIGVVLGAAYLLWMVQRVFTGPVLPKWSRLPDATLSEVVVFCFLAVAIVGIGFFPSLVSEQYDLDVSLMANRYAKPLAEKALPEKAAPSDQEAAPKKAAVLPIKPATEGRRVSMASATVTHPLLRRRSSQGEPH